MNSSSDSHPSADAPTPAPATPLATVAAATAPRIAPQARSFARQRALQALYQWLLTGDDIGQIERQFYEDQEMDQVDNLHFRRLLHGIPEKITELDQLITPLIDRPLDQLTPIEHTILRIGCYELRFCGEDVPWKVAINESVELAKKFGAEESFKYINGVLDKLSPQANKPKMRVKPTRRKS